MKTKRLVSMFAVLCATAFAGTLRDSANVLGPRATEVGNRLASQPVWVETFVRTPDGGLKGYTNKRVAELTDKGFLVVITSQPREWRISMNPVGLASSEAVRMAGDHMVSQFKQGRFAEGIEGLASELVRLTQPEPVATPHAAQQRVELATVPKKDNSLLWWLIAGGVFGVLVIVSIFWLVNRTDRKERERQEARERRNRAPTPSVIANPATATDKQRAEAQRLWDSYTPSERERLIERTTYHNTYSSGASSDPLMFWLLLNASQPHYYPAYGAPMYSPPAASYAPSPAPSYDPPVRRDPDPSPSSSDYSGGGSSYDSGGSSFDSGSSSSDSSGGGGSW